MVIVNPDTAVATATEAGGIGGGRGDGRTGGAVSLAFGMREREKRMVFGHLPLLSVDMSTRREMNTLRRVNAEMTAHHASALVAGVTSENAMRM
jgi:hypothetical protein